MSSIRNITTPNGTTYSIDDGTSYSVKVTNEGNGATITVTDSNGNVTSTAFVADGKPGKDGTNGTSNYIHIKYSSVASPTDDQMTEAPDKYIGIVVDTTETDPTTASSYTWSKFKGDDAYLHIAYAFSSDGKDGFSTTWVKGASYVGLLSNHTEEDSTNYTDYEWSLIKGVADGEDGQSIKGDDAYLHIAYAFSSDGKDGFSTTWVKGASYIGLLSNHTEEDSTNYTDYEWSLIKGADGQDGKDGKDGTNGTSNYIHIKYSSVASPKDDQMTEAPDKYIGIAVDTTETDPTTASSYTWSKFKGDDGIKGTPGKDGTNGTSNYIHIKYSSTTSPTDDQMTEAPDKYIGIAVDTTETDPTTASSYTWSKFKGDDAYLHIAYAFSSDGKDGFSTTWVKGASYVGLLSNHTEEDSTNYTDYEWSLIKGAADGDDGVIGDPFDYLEAKYPDGGAGLHNSIYRGKNLGTSLTDAQYNSIKSGKFTGIWLGDYWSNGGIIYRNGGANYFGQSGDNSTPANHILVIPDSVVLAKGSTTKYMQDTDAVPATGYIGTKMWTDTLPNKALPIFSNIFGSHILSHREILCNGARNGAATSWAWTDVSINIPNQAMVYGHTPWKQCAYSDGYQIGNRKTLLPLFAVRPDLVHTISGAYWLSDFTSSTRFAYVCYDGNADNDAASIRWVGVRPYVIID